MKLTSQSGWKVAALSAGGAVILLFLTARFLPPSGVSQSDGRAGLEIQHPIAGAVLPFNLPAPTVLWKTNAPGMIRWTATFRAGKQRWSFEGVEPGWRPPETEWSQMKQAARGGGLELAVAGYGRWWSGKRARHAVRFFVSAEAVEAPLFYRDVNLPFVEAVKDPSKIRWRFGSLGTPAPPPVVLEKLPVCGNCHSFSRNGATLAMDVDYANNKGSYVIAPTAREMQLSASNVITWDDYRREDGQPTLGLLSQISPDGRYVVSTVKDMSVFMATPDLAFSQLFFPFKGILAVYDRETKRFSALPGADDPALVQSNPAWSPDGQWIVFARARAVQGKPAPEPGRVLLTGEAGREFVREIRDYRYDLYRVPFHDGKGGKAEPLRGASGNGRSNYFPKYSPDGRWIVFCQAARYMLLQPDSELFIIPAEGGPARRLGCNLGRMNSWHSWSPDSRWLVFSSKAHSDYTQLYLTQIGEQGEASPPVWLAHLAEPGRAANIPEFVPVAATAIVTIRERFLDDFSYVRAGDEFFRAGEAEPAIEKYRTALSLNPDNLTAHRMLGRLLTGPTNNAEAVVHLQAVVRLEPHDPVARYNLGITLAAGGDHFGAIPHFEDALRHLSTVRDLPGGAGIAKPALPEALHLSLGDAYARIGDHAGAERHYREALQLAPDFPAAHNALGQLLLDSGRAGEAEAAFREAVRLAAYPEAHHNLGLLLLNAQRLKEAEEQLALAIELSPNLGRAYHSLGLLRLRQGRSAEACGFFREALRCNPEDWEARLNLANHSAPDERTRTLAEAPGRPAEASQK
jgi:tetratricopeptide (TPR) repeat protein